jgi:CPA1 family monovalent cation:H+ antiporter
VLVSLALFVPLAWMWCPAASPDVLGHGDGGREVVGPTATEGRCRHLVAAPAVARPGTPDGCEECLRDGTRWEHLRLCLGCGHVGCCDSSPQRHASTHHGATGHPVIRSFEPGESWRWCFVDEQLG